MERTLYADRASGASETKLCEVDQFAILRLTVQVNPIPSSQCDTEEYRQEFPQGELSANLPESAPYSRKAAPHFVGYFDLNFELLLRVVIPFAYVRDSRKKHGKRKGD